MHTDWFDYELPPHLIAQEPLPQREQALLMVVDRRHATIAHHVVNDLPELLDPGDLLVFNDTRVLPARLIGHRTRTGGHWEGLFLSALSDGTWEIMSRTRGRLTTGETVSVTPGPLELTLIRKNDDGHWIVHPGTAEPVAKVLERHGQVPLPPYIRKGVATTADRERYQTVFARHPGAVAAPTAGLHFSPPLFEQLKQRGIGWTFLTLHVGLGTFQPIQVDSITKHRMHREWGELSAAAVEAIRAGRQRGNRVVAVGTTAVRVLETVASTGEIRPWTGETDLFIYPPYRFQAVDALVTNFHLPRTTLLLLVGAFAGPALLRRAYEEAIARRYRFFSYGDAMFIFGQV
jgi:S-adenosylmethionine:tRNA ribosyltransferase-isomerase